MSSSIRIPSTPHPASPSSSLSSSSPPPAARRASLLSSSLAAQEHTVVDVGLPEGPLRLITCVKASQGFDWNQEIFLPSHAGYHNETDYADLERRKDPVHEIVLTDEEREKMFPQ